MGQQRRGVASQWAAAWVGSPRVICGASEHSPFAVQMEGLQVQGGQGSERAY